MADETQTPTTIPSAPAVESAAPVVAAPSVETPAIAPLEAPTDAPVEVAKTAETVKTEAPVENILGVDPVKEGVVKPEAAEKKDDGAKTDAAPVETKVELPTYEEFKLPENIKLEKEPLDNFTKILGEIETGKLDHKGYQEVGQKLVDLAAQNTLESINRLNDHYVQIHQNNVKARVDALKADPELGGDNFGKTVELLQDSIRTYGGTEAQVAEFRKEVTESGLGASPAVCRLIYNMQQKINKYTTEDGANRVVPASAPAPSKVKAYQAFYNGGSK